MNTLALYARLSRQVSRLSDDRREALLEAMGDDMTHGNVADIDSMDAVERELRQRITELLDQGDTLAAIAGRACLHTSPVYRWWKGESDLKLASFGRLCDALGMRLIRDDRHE
jgi:DNA-binding phage protein